MPAGSGGGSGEVLTDAQIIALWIYEGGSISSAKQALARALSESSGNTAATSGNPNGGTNVGLYQLDTTGVGSGYSISQLEDPYTNTQITVKATNNGANWSEWADNWQDFISQADSAVSTFQNSAGGSSSLSSYAKSVLKGIGGANAESQSGNSNTGSGSGGWLSFLTDPVSAATDMLKIVEFLINPLSWLRIMAGFAGFVFLGAGLFMMAKAA
jgi:Lysozyme like domain